ncbi:MAG: ATP-binding cassette domain-containing protein [Pseudomonadota bacterium]
MPDGLEIRNVVIRKCQSELLRINTKVEPGAVLTLMGPSGVGKSTLLSLIMGDLPRGFSAEGTVRLNGKDLNGLAPEARRVGILYQDPLLFPHLDVAANLGFGLPRGGTHAERRHKIAGALREIGLDDYGPRDPATLSGGQAARVALMRVLLSKPEALLLDEPFSKLDTGLRDQMRRLVFGGAKAAAVPVLMVTHDDADAAAAGGEIIRLSLRST